MLLQDILKHKKSDTIVIYGSGYSLNSHTEKDWDHLKQFDSIGFNWFVLQEWISPTFLVVGDIRPDKKFDRIGPSKSEAYKNYKLCSEEDRYQNTLFFVASDKVTNFPYKKLNRQTHLYDRHKGFDPKDILKICAISSTLFACVDISIQLGYKIVIFDGVDLYDYRYFFMPAKDKLRIQGTRREEPKWRDDKLNDSHPVTRNTLRFFNNRHEVLKKTKIKFFSYNPKSLLLQSKIVKQYLCDAGKEV